MRLRELKQLQKLATPSTLEALQQKATQWKAAAAVMKEANVEGFTDAVSAVSRKSTNNQNTNSSHTTKAALRPQGDKHYSTLAGHNAPVVRGAIPYPPKPSTFPAVDARIATFKEQVARREILLPKG